jgi:hypothetical protein
VAALRQLAIRKHTSVRSRHIDFACQATASFEIELFFPMACNALKPRGSLRRCPRRRPEIVSCYYG